MPVAAPPAAVRHQPTTAPPPPIPGGNVIQFRHRSAKLLRPGINRATGTVADPYSEFLDRIPDLTPAQVPQPLIEELVPQGVDIPQVAALDEKTQASDDPERDAWGRGKPNVAADDLSL